MCILIFVYNFDSFVTILVCLFISLVTILVYLFDSFVILFLYICLIVLLQFLYNMFDSFVNNSHIFVWLFRYNYCTFFDIRGEHQNLVLFLGLSRDSPVSCIVYEYMVGGSLLERLASPQVSSSPAAYKWWLFLSLYVFALSCSLFRFILSYILNIIQVSQVAWLRILEVTRWCINISCIIRLDYIFLVIQSYYTTNYCDLCVHILHIKAILVLYKCVEFVHINHHN